MEERRDPSSSSSLPARPESENPINTSCYWLVSFFRVKCMQPLACAFFLSGYSSRITVTSFEIGRFGFLSTVQSGTTRCHISYGDSIIAPQRSSRSRSRSVRGTITTFPKFVSTVTVKRRSRWQQNEDFFLVPSLIFVI